MQTEGSTDFWQGHASLLVTDGKGGEIPLPDWVRLYLFASIQRGSGSVAANFPFNQYPANPAEYGAVHRALVAPLDQWVSREVPPSPCHFPRMSDGTLIGASSESYGFPSISGVIYPVLVNELSENDYSTRPSKPAVGRKYLILAPKIDEDGNDIAGVRVPDITVPRGTHTGWNLRRPGFGERELLLLGSYFAFAATKKDRNGSGDPRLSLEERYPTNEHYLKAIAQAADTLEKERLTEDVGRIVKAAAARTDK
jgi:hypothetical protein